MCSTLHSPAPRAPEACSGHGPLSSLTEARKHCGCGVLAACHGHREHGLSLGWGLRSLGWGLRSLGWGLRSLGWGLRSLGWGLRAVRAGSVLGVGCLDLCIVVLN
jgi:hypothetical protein